MSKILGNCGREAQIIEVNGNILGTLGESDANETVIRYLNENCSYCDLLSVSCFPLVRWARRGDLGVAVVSAEEE